MLLVLENYPELAFCETLLKKVGVDVESCQNDMSVPDLILNFRPDLVIASSVGRKVNGLRVAGKLLHAPYPTAIVLLAADVTSISEDDRRNFNISGVLSTPVEPSSFLTEVAKLLNLDIELLLKKSSRTLGAKPDETTNWVKSAEVLTQLMDSDTTHVAGANLAPGGNAPELIKEPVVNPASLDSEKRRARFAAALSQIPEPAQNGIQRALVGDQIRDFRKRESDPEIEDIDLERQRFTVELFERAHAAQSMADTGSGTQTLENSGVKPTRSISRNRRMFPARAWALAWTWAQA